MTVLTILTAPRRPRPDALRSIEHDHEVRWVDAEALPAALVGADVLLMWDFFSPALREAYRSADRLTWIHAASAGVDSLLFDELVASDVVVTNARGIFDRPIAEFVLGFLLHFAKDTAHSMDLQERQVWDHRDTENLVGSTAMIVGTGSIGTEIGRVLSVLGVHVRGAGSRARSGDPVFGEVVASSDLAAHLGEVDWLINAAPLTPATTGLIDARVLAALPPRARVINIGRGATVVTADLLAALEAGTIAGAGLDVMDPEPPPAGHPLWIAPNTLITAHLSGDTHGWNERLAEQFLANWEKYLAGEPVDNRVDLQRGYVPR